MKQKIIPGGSSHTTMIVATIGNMLMTHIYSPHCMHTCQDFTRNLQLICRACGSMCRQQHAVYTLGWPLIAYTFNNGRSTAVLMKSKHKCFWVDITCKQRADWLRDFIILFQPGNFALGAIPTVTIFRYQTIVIIITVVWPPTTKLQGMIYVPSYH